jgi:hypothetical protein
MNIKVNEAFKRAKKIFSRTCVLHTEHAFELLYLYSFHIVTYHNSYRIFFADFLPDCNYAARLSLTSDTHHTTPEVAHGTSCRVTLSLSRLSRITLSSCTLSRRQRSVALCNRSTSPAQLPYEEDYHTQHCLGDYRGQVISACERAITCLSWKV